MRKIKSGIAFVSVLLLFSNCNDETFENPQEISATTKLLSGINSPDMFKDVKGIYSMLTTKDYSEKTGISGHSDLMFTDSNNLGNCVYGCFFERPIERIDVWILN